MLNGIYISFLNVYNIIERQTTFSSFLSFISCAKTMVPKYIFLHIGALT